MNDFLKTNPHVSREQYMWEWSIPQIQLASYDFTHIEYLSEEQAKATKSIDSGEDLLKDLGIPLSAITKKE